MAHGMRGTQVKALAIFLLVAFVALSVDAKSHKKNRKVYGGGPAHGGGATLPDVWSRHGLQKNFYGSKCASAEKLVTAAVQAAFAKDPSITAGLIRLAFHDCFVRGCDASVLLDGLDTEKQGAPNLNSLRGFEVIDAAKAAVEKVCPGVVSCADIVSFAGRDSIVLGGGYNPYFWPGGRRDGSTSQSADTLTSLPAPFFNYTQVVNSFAAKGLNQYEMITLSTAHTVGRAHCGAILARLYNFKATGLPDPAIDVTYLRRLQGLCPQTAPGNIINMDMTTPDRLDIDYIKDVFNHRGLFESDNALQTVYQGRLTLSALEIPGVFGPAFTAAMIKMSTIQVLTGSQGKIRTNCRIA